MTPVSIHGDRYVDLAIALEGDAGPPVVGRVGADDCPESLAPGERVSVRFTMGVMVPGGARGGLAPRPELWTSNQRR